MDIEAKFEQYLSEIKIALSSINPALVIIFGSASTGNLQPDSDIDLLVILDSDELPSTYESKMANKLFVRKAIREITKKVPIDALVFTKAEYRIILEHKNSFFREIDLTGKILYEKAS